MIGQGFDRHWTGLDSGWTDLVNFPALGQTLDRGWTWFGFCVQALSNQPLLRSTQKGAFGVLKELCTPTLVLFDKFSTAVTSELKSALVYSELGMERFINFCQFMWPVNLLDN